MRAYLDIRRPLVAALLAVCIFSHRTLDMALLMCRVGLALLVFVVLTNGLAWFFRAQGWNLPQAFALPLAPSVIAVSLPLRTGPNIVQILLEFAAIMSIQSIVESAVNEEFRRFGLSRYCDRLSRKGKIDEIVAALRMRERQASTWAEAIPSDGAG